MEEKPQMSQASIDAMRKSNEFIARTAFLLMRALEERDANSVLELHSMLEKDARRKNRAIPLCHVVPMVPRNLYFNSWMGDQPMNVEMTFSHKAAFATMNPQFLDCDSYGVMCNEYDVVCNVGALLSYLIRKVYGRINVERLEEKYASKNELVWSAMWLILPKREFDICDIVAAPDRRLSSILPRFMLRRLEKRGIQQFFDECNENDRPHCASRFD